MNVIKTAPDKPVNIKVNKGLSKLESFLVDIIYKAYEKPQIRVEGKNFFLGGG